MSEANVKLLLTVLAIFYDTFLPIIDALAPLRKKRVKSAVLPGWLTPEITEAPKLCDQLKIKLKQLHNDLKGQKLDSTHPQSKLEIEKASLEYRKQRNKVTHLIRQKAYFRKIVTENKDTA